MRSKAQCENLVRHLNIVDSFLKIGFLTGFPPKNKNRVFFGSVNICAWLLLKRACKYNALSNY